MLGAYSISSTGLPGTFSGGVSPTTYTKPWHPNLPSYNKYGQTSSGIDFSNTIFDRESGRAITIQLPAFDLKLSVSSVSMQADTERLSLNELLLLSKCLIAIQTVPGAFDKLEELISEISFEPSMGDGSLEQTRQSLPIDELVFDPDATPVWELAAQARAQVPDEEWNKLPTDLAENHDYYQGSSQGKN